MHRKPLLDIFMEEKNYGKAYEYLWKGSQINYDKYCLF